MKPTEHAINDLPCTGERFLPVMGGGIELEHLHRYQIASKLVVGKRVLDIASGEGYGSFLLSSFALSVVGVDISAEAISFASSKYQVANLKYINGSCADIPLEDNMVDVVVSFETIEHHDLHEEMMREIRRVLVPGGLLIISCPDKLEYSDRVHYNNPYHIKELYYHEFASLLDRYFANKSISGQKLIYGSGIFSVHSSEYQNYLINDESITPTTIDRAVYLIALASDSVLPSIENGIFERSILDSEEVVKREMIISALNTHIGNLESERERIISELNTYKNSPIIRLFEFLHGKYLS